MPGEPARFTVGYHLIHPTGWRVVDRAARPGHDWLTTPRNLHRYLRQCGPGGRPAPLAPGYQTPEGEEPIP